MQIVFHCAWHRVNTGETLAAAVIFKVSVNFGVGEKY
jgi:hypothetical protein